jgi:hypothetical protein
MDQKTSAPEAENGESSWPAYSPNPAPLILPHQRAAFNSLIEVGSACFSIARQTLKIAPRTNTLLVGQTGSGKNFLAKQVAAALDVPFMGLSIGEWMPLGSSNRGAVHTWPSIVNFLLRNFSKPGVVILIDEVCKLGTSDWSTYVTQECFRLFDLSISTELGGEDEDTLSPQDHKKAEEVLRNRTLLIGAGAFQDIWDSAGYTIGFNPHSNLPDISLSRLAKALPRELVNRFRSHIVTLPALTISDYNSMLETAVEAMPSYLRSRFMQLGRERIGQAALQQQGVRFLEELVQCNLES